MLTTLHDRNLAQNLDFPPLQPSDGRSKLSESDAMVRLRLNDPSFTDELVSFLRRCQCQVRDLGRATIAVGVGHDVDAEAVVRRLNFGLCCRCAEEIEQALFRLGSPHCHDCRESSGHSRRPETEIREEWTRMEVESYLRVWRALHPGAAVELVA